MKKADVEAIEKAITAGIMIAVEELLDAFPPPTGNLEAFAAQTKVMVKNKVRARLHRIATE
jgi:hypothetical protein